MKIIPTVGRIVLCYYNDGRGFDESQTPMAAIIAYVWKDDLITVAVFDHSGRTFSLPCIKLLEEGERAPPDEARQHYCRWMPYQIGQAKKHEKESTGDTVTETT